MNTFLEKQFPVLVGLAYAAALDPGQWAVFLDELSRVLDHAPVNFYLYDALSRSAAWTIQRSSDPEYAVSFASHYAARNPYQTINLLAQPTGSVYLATAATPKEEVEETAFFNEWMKPQGIASDHPSANLLNDGHRCICLALAPPHWQRANERAAYAKKIELIIPHIMRSLELSRQIGTLDATRQAMVAALECIERAAILIDPSGRPLHLNSKALALLRDATGAVTIDPFGKLAPRIAAHDFASLIKRVVTTRRAVGPVLIKGGSVDGTVKIWIVPIPREPSSSGPIIAPDWIDAARDRPAALVLLAPVKALAVDADAIAAAFGLSASEAHLAAALVGGVTLADYARRAGLSRHTCRNQLASIFVKINVHRQVELVARILNVVGEGA